MTPGLQVEETFVSGVLRDTRHAELEPRGRVQVPAQDRGSQAAPFGNEGWIISVNNLEDLVVEVGGVLYPL